MRVTLDLDRDDLQILIMALDSVIYDLFNGYWQEKSLQALFRSLLDKVEQSEEEDESSTTPCLKAEACESKP